VRVLNFFRANDTVYMVMTYESGRSLQEHVIRNRSKEQKDVLSERFIRRVFTQVMNGLREVHSNRLLHLDVKPANIYLRMDGTPILLDFGAARQTLQRDISKTYPMYTPGFAAPELYKRDAELGPWTDVYSIGACIYACMSGMPPQESDQRLKDDRMPQALRSFRGLYSAQMISMVERCLRLNSLERPQTVYAVQKELVNNVPEKPEFSVAERTGARVRHMQERFTRFLKEHNITWF
jgi:eukaryotic-like serine/threonine-protein kinase